MIKMIVTAVTYGNGWTIGTFAGAATVHEDLEEGPHIHCRETGGALLSKNTSTFPAGVNIGSEVFVTELIG
jgi:hypothetical protein